jgi:PAS domain S-box-containing protein
MTSKSVAKKKSFSPWHFVWISVVVSEILTAVLNIIQSHLLIGEYSPLLLKVGALDSLLVPLIIAPVVIYFIKQTSDLVKNNEQLLQEIEERKRMEAALRATEKKIALHVKQTPLGVIEWNLKFTVETWNPAAEFIFGYSEHEAIGSDLSFIIPERYREAVGKRWRDLIEQKRGMRSTDENVTKKGNIIDCEWYNTPLVDAGGTVIGVASFVKDITARKRLETEYKTVLQGTSDGFWISDMNGRFIDVNNAYCRLIGYSREELLSMGIPDVEAIEKQVDVAQRIKKIVVTGNDSFETRHRRKDGVLVDIEVSVSFLNIGGGRFYVFLRDITARKKTEEILRASESKYRRLHQSMMDGYVYVDMNGKIEDFNDSYRLMLGYSAEELRELNFRDITPEQWREWQDSVIKGQVLIRGYSDVYEKEYRKKDGTIFPVEIRTSLVKDDSGSNIGMWAIVRDITERTLAQKEKEKLYREQLEEKQRHLTEREGLLMDLHDGVGGLVTNIRLLADLSQKMSDRESIKVTLVTISQLSMDAISEIRGLMQSLDSSELNWRTLVATLRSEGAAMIEAHGISFTAESKVAASDQPGSLLWVNLFRIYKEALTNIIKHAHAKSVTVILQISNGKLTLDVRDDGVGWNGQTTSGRGLAIMQKRAKDLGGAVTVSAGNAGTRVSLEIPLPTKRFPATSDILTGY